MLWFIPCIPAGNSEVSHAEFDSKGLAQILFL